MKLNQKGAVDLLLAATLAVVIIVGGFVVWRVQSTQEDTGDQSGQLKVLTESEMREEFRCGRVTTDDLATDVYCSDYDQYVSDVENGILLGEDDFNAHYDTLLQRQIDQRDSTQSEHKTEDAMEVADDFAFSGDQSTYVSNQLGFKFVYPVEYGEVNEESSYGSENQNALRYTFYFDNICPTCEGNNPFAVEMSSDYIVEIGATTSDFGGIGTGRPYASSSGFEGEGNFTAANTTGLLNTTEDEWHGVTRTTIEFNLTKSNEATGIMFMTNDNPGQTMNAENLKVIAATFELVD